MSNKELYKQAFSVLQMPGDISLEDKQMAIIRKKAAFRTALAVAAAVLMIIIVGGGTAYATNLGDIQKKFGMWLHGRQGSAVIEYGDDGLVSVEYVDEDGNHLPVAGWVDSDNPGPMTPEEEEEVIAQLNNDVRVEFSGGTVTLYYQDQVIDITDKFIDGVCEIHVYGKPYGWHVTVDYATQGVSCGGDHTIYETSSDEEIARIEHRPVPGYAECDLQSGALRMDENGRIMIRPAKFDGSTLVEYTGKEKHYKLAKEAFFYYYPTDGYWGEAVNEEYFLSYLKYHRMGCYFHLNKAGKIDYIRGIPN